MKSLIAALAISFAFIGAAHAGGSISAPPNPVSAYATWTGMYVEGAIGATTSLGELGVAGCADCITLGENGYQAHAGIGYDVMVMPKVVVGALARIGVDDIEHKAFGLTIAEQNEYYVLAARAGFVPTSNWMIYGLAGWKWSELETIGPNFSRGGLLLGAGIEVMATDKVFLGIEANTTLYGDDTIATGLGPVKLDTTDYAGLLRAGLRF